MPRLFASGAIGLLAVCASAQQPSSANDPLDGLDPGLPRAVRIEARNHAEGVDKPPLSQSTMEIAPGWGRLEGYMNQGGFGMQLQRVRSYDTTEFFAYEVPSRTGAIAARQPSYRVVANVDSPIEYWHALRGLIQDGAVPVITHDGPLSTITIDASPLGPATWRFTLVREPVVELRELRIEGGTKFMRMTYSDYRDIKGGGRHPFRIDIEAVDKAAPLDTRPTPVVIISKIEPLTDLSQPARWTLPDEAVIVDQRTGQAVNGKGQRIDIPAPQPSKATVGSGRSIRSAWVSNGLIFAGIGLVVVGGIVWARRRFAA